jgi:hypothetical protein
MVQSNPGHFFVIPQQRANPGTASGLMGSQRHRAKRTVKAMRRFILSEPPATCPNLDAYTVSKPLISDLLRTNRGADAMKRTVAVGAARIGKTNVQSTADMDWRTC